MAEIPPITSLTREAIFSGYEADASDGFRSHLGASIIGKECERALWYDFRWVTRSQFSGRVLRLFETGQLEESRLVRNLRRTGATVLEVDPQTGRQFRVVAHGGHFGGSLDGIAINLLEAPKSWHVLEFKTHANKSFTDLVAKKVRESKPQHFAQMQIYMALMAIDRAMYLAVNKDTDDLYVERVEADPKVASSLLAKAHRIIFAAAPPPRISDDPAWYQCRMCDHAPVCHAKGSGAGMPEVNCRTCLHSTPVEGGWHCDRHQKRLTEVDQRTGCDQHLYLPPLVPATQVDAGDDWVDYEFSNGVLWRDAGLIKHAGG
ncbi:MAG: oxidoreductase [Betaproteobacteria bacterium]|nr:oxidoreductase [Betaproteobacteria bacterium]